MYHERDHVRANVQGYELGAENPVPVSRLKEEEKTEGKSYEEEERTQG